MGRPSCLVSSPRYTGITTWGAARRGGGQGEGREEEEEDQDERYKRGRRGQSGRQSQVRDLALLCSLVSRSLLAPDLRLTVRECGQVWDLVTDKTWLATNNVNRARRFLHSRGSESSASTSREETEWRERRDSGSSQTSQVSQASQEEDWVTPPSSPEGSVASMRTCSEPAQVWVVGQRPSNQDRRLLETLQLLPREKMKDFPSISQYLAQLSLYSRTEQLGWKDPYHKPSVKNSFSGLARRLDLNVTF